MRGDLAADQVVLEGVNLLRNRVFGGRLLLFGGVGALLRGVLLGLGDVLLQLGAVHAAVGAGDALLQLGQGGAVARVPGRIQLRLGAGNAGLGGSDTALGGGYLCRSRCSCISKLIFKCCFLLVVAVLDSLVFFLFGQMCLFNFCKCYLCISNSFLCFTYFLRSGCSRCL